MSKPPSASRVEMTQLVLPGDTNSLGTAFGGKIMQWVDMAAGVAARRHSGCTSVTAYIDGMRFAEPVQLGDVVVLRASVNRTWRTSMEVGVRVDCESRRDGRVFRAAHAYLTFVGVDDEGRPQPVTPVGPVSEDEKRRYEEAQQRRERRLIDAAEPVGGMHPEADVLGAVLSRLAHDLNNPLSVVLSNLKYLEGELREPEVAGAAEESAAAAESLKEIVELTAALSPLRTGQTAPRVAPIDLGAVRDLVNRRMGYRLGSRRLTWDLGIERVNSDGSLLTMLISAIIDHCVKRCPPGGTVDVRTFGDDEGWTLRITDSGPPFAAEHTPSFLSKTLNDNESLDARYRNDGGIGLHVAGLAARAMGAKTSVRARSRLDDTGVAFDMAFPRRDGPEGQ